eukprot:scaffold646_cov367-Prasinococcus_capsulatus_cf.AAC.10
MAHNNVTQLWLGWWLRCSLRRRRFVISTHGLCACYRSQRYTRECNCGHRHLATLQAPTFHLRIHSRAAQGCKRGRQTWRPSCARESLRPGLSSCPHPGVAPALALRRSKHVTTPGQLMTPSTNGWWSFRRAFDCAKTAHTHSVISDSGGGQHAWCRSCAGFGLGCGLGLLGRRLVGGTHLGSSRGRPGSRARSLLSFAVRCGRGAQPRRQQAEHHHNGITHAILPSLLGVAGAAAGDEVEDAVAVVCLSQSPLARRDIRRCPALPARVGRLHGRERERERVRASARPLLRRPRRACIGDLPQPLRLVRSRTLAHANDLRLLAPPCADPVLLLGSTIGLRLVSHMRENGAT